MKANINDLIAKLEQKDRDLGDPGDVLNTINAQATFWATKATIAQTISGLKNAPADLAKPIAQLADIEQRRAVVVAKQTEIEQQIAEAPDWRSVADARERDREYDRLQHLRRQLQLLHDGQLLCAPETAFERIGDLDARIVELTRERDRAQNALNAYLQQAKALMAEPVTA